MQIEVKPGIFVSVDEDMVEMVVSRRWHIKTIKTKQGRVYRYAYTGSQCRLALHRMVTGAQRPLVVDHIDGDGLNNMRANLRVCTHSQNMRNRRANAGKLLPKGVTQRGKYFCAEIKAGSLRLRKRGFETAEAAADQYAAWSEALHGAFGNCGSPPTQPAQAQE